MMGTHCRYVMLMTGCSLSWFGTRPQWTDDGDGVCLVPSGTEKFYIVSKSIQRWRKHLSGPSSISVTNAPKRLVLISRITPVHGMSPTSLSRKVQRLGPHPPVIRTFICLRMWTRLCLPCHTCTANWLWASSEKLWLSGWACHLRTGTRGRCHHARL